MIIVMNREFKVVGSHSGNNSGPFVVGNPVAPFVAAEGVAYRVTNLTSFGSDYIIQESI
jgi:hypothetical protein